MKSSLPLNSIPTSWLHWSKSVNWVSSNKTELESQSNYRREILRRFKCVVKRISDPDATLCINLMFQFQQLYIRKHTVESRVLPIEISTTLVNYSPSSVWIKGTLAMIFQIQHHLEIHTWLWSDLYKGLNARLFKSTVTMYNFSPSIMISPGIRVLSQFSSWSSNKPVPCMCLSLSVHVYIKKKIAPSSCEQVARNPKDRAVGTLDLNGTSMTIAI